MKRPLAIVSAALMWGGCAARQPAPVPPPPKMVFEASHRPEAPPLPTGAELLAAQPAEVREAVKQHEQKGRWPEYKTGNGVWYPYGKGSEPVVDCAPLRTTDVQLGAGETVADLALGDQERWMATPASSGDPRNPTPHIALKPQASGLETNLTIYTTRHIYHLDLRSHEQAMREVEFYYPDDLLAAMTDADAAVAKSKAAKTSDPLADDTVKSAAVDPAAFNFSYKIDGPNLPFKPVRAFDDGSHVYIQMGQEMKTSEAPALLIAAGGGTQMVNYRVDGDYYVVDRLFNQAELVTGVGRQQDRVTIAYAGTTRN